VLVLAALTASVPTLLLSVPAPADARVHSFSPLSGPHAGSATLKLAGVAPPAVVDARLGRRPVSVAKVRRAARSHGRLIRIRPPAARDAARPARARGMRQR